MRRDDLGPLGAIAADYADSSSDEAAAEDNTAVDEVADASGEIPAAADPSADKVADVPDDPPGNLPVAANSAANAPIAKEPQMPLSPKSHRSRRSRRGRGRTMRAASNKERTSPPMQPPAKTSTKTPENWG